MEHGKDYYPANVKVYNWFLKLISDLDNVHHGNRYRCMYALAVYGVKCGISPEVVKEDLLLLLPKYNEIKSNHYDAKYMLDIKVLKMHYLHISKRKHLGTPLIGLWNSQVSIMSL